MNGSDYDDIDSDNTSEHNSPQTHSRSIRNYMNEISDNVKVYILSIFTAAYIYTPLYAINTCKWVKIALVDAPVRFTEDVDRQYMKIKKHLSDDEKGEKSETVKEA